jgi:conjugative transfer signal peptidase TraF
LALFWFLGFRLNLTYSVPFGLYRLSGARPSVGDTVSFCLPSGNPYAALALDRGYVGHGGCPSGLRPLLKRLVAASGDFLTIGPEGISVNGVLLPDSSRPISDSRGRSLPRSLLRAGAVPPGMALVMSEGKAYGFDGRHFGLVEFSSLSSVKPMSVF